MSNEKFKVKFGLAVGDTAATVDGTTGDIVTNGYVKTDNGTTGEVTVGGASAGKIEIGQYNRATSGTPYIDFHSSANPVDYDVRVEASGGTSAQGQGTLTVYADSLVHNGDLTVTGDLAVNGGAITTTASTGSLFNSTNTVSIGANTGTTTINNALSADSVSTTAGGVSVSNATITTSNSTASIFDASALTGGLYNAATAVSIGANTGTLTLKNPTVVGDAANTTVNLWNTVATTVNFAGAGTAVSIGANTGTTTINNSLVADDISITTVDTTNLEVTNIKAKDGTAAASIANTTGVITVSSELNVDNLNLSTNTISSTNTNGNINITPNGTGKVYTSVTMMNDASQVAGSLQATTNSSYTFPFIPLTTVSNNNGLDAASSMPANTLGYAAQQQITHYFGDTFAGPLTSAGLSLKSANGNSVTGGTVPFTGVAQTAASALPSTAALGTINYNGYATTGFTDYIATRNQGGGFNGLHATQIQSYAAEALADGTLTISGATITNVTRSSFALSSVSVSGTKGQITFTASSPAVGQAINVTGTNTGTSTGITAGTYYIVAVASTTSCTLSATPGGQPITTTAGTTTGLTFSRRFITVTYSAQSNIPFGLNALIAVANITGVTNGTYMAVGTSTTTSVLIGIDTTSVSLPGTQSLSLPTVTNAGTGFRVRAFPIATTMNSGNRLEIIDHKPSGATYRADSFTFNAGSYGNTGVGVVGTKLIYNRVYGQWQYNTLINGLSATPTTYIFPLGSADFNNIATVASSTQLIPGAIGKFNFQFSVQCGNTSATAYDAYIWLKKDGVDVTGSMGRITVPGSHGGVDGKTIASWNYILDATATTSYFELAYAVENSAVYFTPYSAETWGPSTATLITTLIPIGA